MAIDGNRIRTLRKKTKLTQTEFGKQLGVIKQTVSSWENNVSEPNSETLLNMSSIFKVPVDYLLGREDADGHGLNDGNIEERGLDGPGIADILGYPTDEEKATTFSHKLALQLDFKGSRLTDVAETIGVTDKIVWEWLIGKRKDYSKYYDQLTEYFDLQPGYWTTPGTISPGLILTKDEYFLVLKYRYQNQYDDLKDLPIESFFPDCRKLSEDELKWLNAFRLLNEDNKDIIIGKTKEYLKEQRFESVITDKPKKMAK